MDLREAYRQVKLMRSTMEKMIARDPDQDVQDMDALRVIDKVLVEARGALPPGHSVLDEIRDVISPERVDQGQTMRVADCIHIVNALYAALEGPYLESVNRPSRW